MNYSTYNCHHKVLVNLQASNMDALKSKSCMSFNQICFHVCCKTVLEVVFIFCVHLIQTVTIIVQWKLDGCIVWNAHNTVLGEEALLIYIVPGLRPTSTPSGILIHPTVWPQCTNVGLKTEQTTLQTNGRPERSKCQLSNET